MHAQIKTSIKIYTQLRSNEFKGIAVGRIKNFDKSAALILRLKVEMELARTVSADSEFPSRYDLTVEEKFSSIRFSEWY